MNSLVGLTGAFGIGAGLAYLFDPDRGRRRRALAADQLVGAVHAAGDAADATTRDVKNRVAGTLLGQDPKRAMDDDLVRLKSLLEEGRTRVRGDAVTREQLP